VKHNKAIQELIELELVQPGRYPKITGAQALGCSPVATAFKNGEPVMPVKPSTIAKSLAIGNPSDGKYVINIANTTGGTVESVTEEEIVESIELLAGTEGIFAETAGGVTIGVLRKLARAGRWKGDETVVAYVTGHGFKTIEVIPDLERYRRTIGPSVRAFEETFPELVPD
jgi:threonine synthase